MKLHDIQATRDGALWSGIQRGPRGGLYEWIADRVEGEPPPADPLAWRFRAYVGNARRSTPTEADRRIGRAVVAALVAARREGREAALVGALRGILRADPETVEALAQALAE